MMGRERVKPPCTNCNTGLVHDVCYSSSDPIPVENYNTLWRDDDEDLSERVEALELRIEEMWERMKQYERVLSTAFRLHAENDLHRCT